MSSDSETDTREEVRRDWTDLLFTVVLQATDRYAQAVAEFNIYKIEGIEVHEGPVFWEVGTRSNLPGTPNHARAEVWGEMSVKWDGCSSATIHGAHFCEKEQVTNVGVLFGRIYDWAREIGMDRV